MSTAHTILAMKDFSILSPVCTRPYLKLPTAVLHHVPAKHVTHVTIAVELPSALRHPQIPLLLIFTIHQFRSYTSTHRRLRHNSAVELSCVGVDGAYWASVDQYRNLTYEVLQGTVMNNVGLVCQGQYGLLRKDIALG